MWDSLVGFPVFEIPIVLFSGTCSSYSRNRKICSEQKVVGVFLFVCFQLWLGFFWVGGGQRWGVVQFGLDWFGFSGFCLGLLGRNTLNLNFEFQNSFWFCFYFLCFPDQYSDAIHSQLQTSALLAHNPNTIQDALCLPAALFKWKEWPFTRSQIVFHLSYVNFNMQRRSFFSIPHSLNRTKS